MYENESLQARAANAQSLCGSLGTDQDTMQSEASGLNAVGQRMVGILKQLGTVEDAETRLNGSRPNKDAVQGAAARPVPNGSIATLTAGLDEISGRIRRAQIAADAISRNV